MPETRDRLVLVGVIRREKDLIKARRERWYRIPVRYAPRRKPEYIAFYQTAAFGSNGKRIQYYATVKGYSVTTRKKLLPDEREHPGASQKYLRIELGPVRKLKQPVRNRTRRRITFGFTTLTRLKKSREVSRLFDIPPVENMMRRALKRSGIEAKEEHCVSDGRRTRYRLDFAIFCRKGKIAVECDNEKWHGQTAQAARDRIRDRWLSSRGWTTVRFPDREVCSDLSECIREIRQKIKELGGITETAF